MIKDVDRARELLETAKLQNISDRMLAAAQVHATLAVEAAVRELIDAIPPRDESSAPSDAVASSACARRTLCSGETTRAVPEMSPDPPLGSGGSLCPALGTLRLRQKVERVLRGHTQAEGLLG